MAVQKTLVNCVVDDFNSAGGNPEQLLDFALGEMRYRKNPCRSIQHPPGQLVVHRAAQAGMSLRARHVLEQIVHGHHIGTRQGPRKPEQVGNVDQIELQPLEDGAEFEIALGRGVGLEQRNGVKVRRAAGRSL